MGGPKAQLLFKGRPLLDRVIETLAEAVDEVIIVGASGTEAGVPEFSGVRTIADREAALGPLMGLATGLAAVKTDLTIAVGCDMPLLDGRLLRGLAALAEGYDAVVPVVSGRRQLLHAVYRTSCAAVAERLLDAGIRRLGTLAEAVPTLLVSEAEWSAFNSRGTSFFNLNTVEDIARAELLA